MRARRLAVCLACAALICACPGPSDYTPQIPVQPWGPKGLRALEGPGPSRVHAMRAGEELGGSNAIGQPGDVVLENDQVVFVIDRLEAGAGFAESGGNVVDAADARARKDELGQQCTFFGVFPRQAVYSAVRVGTTVDGRAWVEVRGHELHEAALAVTTTYTLAPLDRALLLETELRNDGPTPINLPGLGDVIQWGGAEKVAPGKALDFRGDSRGAYIAGVGRLSSYALAPLEGDLEATSGGSWTDTFQRRAVTIAPGQKLAYARLLVVGERPDNSSLYADLLRVRRAEAPADGGSGRASAGALGSVHVALAGASAAPAPVPADARVSVRDASGAEVFGIRASGDPPALAARIPAGRWSFAYAGGGGRAGSDPVVADVIADGEASVTLRVSEASALHVACVDGEGAPMPCKVTFERRDGGDAPDFGPAHLAGPARNQATTADGTVDVALAPGAYRVIASRGPEFEIDQADVTLGAGERRALRLSPRRVLDTSGYLGCDFHQHTMLGMDSAVATRDRVVSNAAEGLEVAVASEHNVIADFTPLVRSLHLERDLVSVAGDELTSDASARPWGHANVWPLPYDPARARGGAPKVRDRTPREVFDDLRSAGADRVFQVNHPRTGRTGYFDQAAFDPATGLGSAPGYEARFDALEVWNGRNIDGRAVVLRDFFALLRTRHPVTATADTDTHGVVGQEAGYPRTYVRVADDAHLDAWDEARTADVVRGVKVLRDVVLTNGPMLRVSVNGAGVGGLARGPWVNVKVHVETAPWLRVNEVRVVRASAPDAPLVQSVIETPLASGALGAETAFTLRVPADDALIVEASGDAPMAPVVPGGVETRPWAMTGAVWVDGDGDGQSLWR